MVNQTSPVFFLGHAVSLSVRQAAIYFFFFVGQKNVTKYDSTILKRTGLFGMKVHSFCPMRSLQVQPSFIGSHMCLMKGFSKH